MRRNEIINSLKFSPMNDADHERLCKRFRDCNVRAVFLNGETELRNDVRGPASAMDEMIANPNIARFEYDFNNEWTTAE